jgi:16S rRNA (guanine966-N2)-methyltransferase
MRIIGGRFKGRRLKVPKGRALRPTAARVKEALFDILPHDLSGRRVLDLFAGTGGLAWEALSRGAGEALLVDSSREAGKAIRENATRLGFSSRCRVWIMPVDRALRRLAESGELFDIIFVDPPYERGAVSVVLKKLGTAGLLRAGGMVVVEHSAREPVGESHGRLVLADQRRYGDTLLSFFAGRQL